MSARPAPAPVFGAQARADERLRRAKVKRPELKLVAQQPRNRRLSFSPRMRLFAWFSAGALALFAVVTFHVLLSQGQFALQRVEKRANEQQVLYERARLQVAQLESPSRITSEAVNRLGMVPANKVTPITPSVQQMPRDVSGRAAPVDTQADESTMSQSSDQADSGDWSSVKSQLRSSVSGQ